MTYSAPHVFFSGCAHLEDKILMFWAGEATQLFFCGIVEPEIQGQNCHRWRMWRGQRVGYGGETILDVKWGGRHRRSSCTTAQLCSRRALLAEVFTLSPKSETRPNGIDHALHAGATVYSHGRYCVTNAVSKLTALTAFWWAITGGVTGDVCSTSDLLMTGLMTRTEGGLR